MRDTIGNTCKMEHGHKTHHHQHATYTTLNEKRGKSLPCWPGIPWFCRRCHSPFPHMHRWHLWWANKRRRRWWGRGPRSATASTLGKAAEGSPPALWLLTETLCLKQWDPAWWPAQRRSALPLHCSHRGTPRTQRSGLFSKKWPAVCIVMGCFIVKDQIPWQPTES